MRWSMTPGFVLVIGIFYYLDEGIGCFWWAVLACVSHELGHYGAARLMGGELRWIRLSAVGAEMGLSYPKPLSYLAEMMVVLAGPLVNLISGGVAVLWGNYLVAAINFGLGALNLMPILPLDGGKALWNGLNSIWDSRVADGVVTIFSGVLVGVLVGGGLVALSLFANGSLLITALWLLWMVLGQKRVSASPKR